jgi:energy-coupling factor transporter ATP-binding protein EcfA2
MKIRQLTLQRFCAFEQAILEFSPGLNVFIGENATGKSHLLKLLYSILKSNERAEKNGGSKPAGLETVLAQKLLGVFRPHEAGLGRLVYRRLGRGSGSVELKADSGELFFTLSNLGKLTVKKDSLPKTERSIFIPSREALAMFEGFVAAYEDRELSFDETYKDLCVALSAGAAKGKRLKEAAHLVTPLESVLGGRVHLQGGKFFVYIQDGFIEAHLLAEGLRKVAGLVRLIVNGSLIQNGFLFWDEPEANLNPKLVTKIAVVLQTLAAGGVQVFVATHDYLLSRELSLASEYKTKPVVDIKFFACSRTENREAVTVQAGSTFTDLAKNPILEEFAAHYDRERKLFGEAK